MLALSRKKGEVIRLIDKETGELIAEIGVASILGNRVTLATQAPDRIRIVRGELKEAGPRTPRLGNPKGGPDAPEAK
jgi:carbon storage regulator CsrA